jgi:hypothetical protein
MDLTMDLKHAKRVPSLALGFTREKHHEKAEYAWHDGRRRAFVRSSCFVALVASERVARVS